AIPGGLFGEHAVLAGGSGTGKTTTAMRIAREALTAGWRVIVIDGKASQVTQRRFETVADACTVDFQTTAVQPIDGWRGDWAAIHNRLLATQEFREPYWRHATAAVLRWALAAPG